MIKSMTGFGRAEVSDEKRKITIEIKAVNHRYLDVNMKMPKKLCIFESSIRTVLKEYVERGKIDIFITYEDFTETNVLVKYNDEVAKAYVAFINDISKEFSLENDLKASTLSRFPEVFTLEEQEIDESELWEYVEKALRDALKMFVDARVKEGENLKNDIIVKLDNMLENVSFIEKRAPEIINEYHARLKDKVSEYLKDSSIDEQRIVTEVTLFTDKICIDEEIVRLKSHIEATKDALINGGSLGRKLDFIAQEMNREANTILSKANDLKTSNHAIELKTDIEKVREQIQNIE
ncbi:MAG: YicC family protein [Lachnospiraceae bacterium]|nr:YicC family protein [Lachnospiraceae bacterium]MCI6408561.1 YicC family protein [Lachnospiraceae bacterium]MDY4836534.1 YicC/YloC family endoribonuclease [Lachnospiraceae bacterium]